MKRFNFKLTNVLKLRKFYERQAELELAKAISEKNMIESRLKEIAALKAEALVKLTDKNNDINTIQDIQTYITRLDYQKEEQLKQLVLADDLVNKKSEAYSEASSQRKVISKLEDKEYAQWKAENNKIEDNVIDDIVTSKYNING